MRTFIMLVLAGVSSLADSAQAAIVTVTAQGNVIFNGVTAPPLSGVTPGSAAVMTFQVDSNNFVNGAPGDTRGYAIIQPTFSLTFNGSTSVGLVNPFPAGQTPYFTLVDGFPVSDGFFVSTNPFSPGGVPISQTPLNANLDLGYVGSTLSSLDILDAVGAYGFDGLTRFSFTLWQTFPENTRMEIDFSSLTIVPAPSSLAVLAAAALIRARPRRSR